MRRSFVPAALFLLLSIFVIACGGNDTKPSPTQGAVANTAAAGTPESSPSTAAASTPAPLPALPPAPALDWSECGAFECAEYNVPLDYANPARNQITLSVERLASTDPAQRIGTLFANPGGPGGSAIDVLSGWARGLPSSLRSRFDIVLFDPRGVGQSSPLICHDNLQQLIGLNPYPRTDADWQTIEDATQHNAAQCGDVGSDILPFLGTESVARDMDRLREAIGDPTLTYFGYSYGTTIGQVYADLFPTHVRAMVLDGAVDVSLTADQRALEQTIGFESAFQRYLANCKATDCLPGDPETTVRDLIAGAEEDPIPAATGDRPIGAGEAVYAIIGSLYSKTSWPFLTLALNAALKDDGSNLLYLVDSFVGRQGDGNYDNSNEMNSAVNCLDYVNDRDPAHYRELAREFEQQAPFFGEATGQLGLYCAYWQTDPKPLHTPRAAGAPPILVVGTTGDPATPYKWAVALSHQLESAVLLTRDGEGHTAYRTGSSCIDDAVNTYLLEVQTPPPGTVCESAGITPEPPVGP